ncbi:hypothetical protein VaNZ11_012892, partial [Volvox africanus]
FESYGFQGLDGRAMGCLLSRAKSPTVAHNFTLFGRHDDDRFPPGTKRWKHYDKSWARRKRPPVLDNYYSPVDALLRRAEPGEMAVVDERHIRAALQHAVQPVVVLTVPILTPVELDAEALSGPLESLLTNHVPPALDSEPGRATFRLSRGGEAPSLVMSTEQGSTSLRCVLANSAALQALGLEDEQEVLGFLARSFRSDRGLVSLFQDTVKRLLAGHLTTAKHFVPGDFGRDRYFLSMRISPFAFRTNSNVTGPVNHQSGINGATSATAGGSNCGTGGMGPTMNGTIFPGMLLELDVPYEGKELAARLQRDYMILSNIPSMVTIFDMDGHVLHQNRSSVGYMGYLVGQGLSMRQQSHHSHQALSTDIPQGSGRMLKVPCLRGSCAPFSFLRPSSPAPSREANIHSVKQAAGAQQQSPAPLESSNPPISANLMQRVQSLLVRDMAAPGAPPGNWEPGLKGTDLAAVPALQRLFLLDRDKLVDLMGALAEGKEWRGLVRMPCTLLPEHAGEDEHDEDGDLNGEEEDIGTGGSAPGAQRPDSCTSPGQSCQDTRFRAPSEVPSLVNSLSARVMFQSPTTGMGSSQDAYPEKEGNAPQVVHNPPSNKLTTKSMNAQQGPVSSNWRGQSAYGDLQQQQQQRKQRLHRVSRCQSTSSVLQQLRATVRQQPQYIHPTQHLQQQPAQHQQDPSTPQQQRALAVRGNSVSQLTLSIAAGPGDSIETPDGPSPVRDAPEPAGDAPESLTQQGAKVQISDGVLMVPLPAANDPWVSGTAACGRGQRPESHGRGLDRQQHSKEGKMEEEEAEWEKAEEDARRQEEDAAVGEAPVFAGQPGLSMRLDSPLSPTDAGRTLFQLFTDTSVGTVPSTAISHSENGSDLFEQPDTMAYKPKDTSSSRASAANAAGSSGSQIPNRPPISCIHHSQGFPFRSPIRTTSCSNPHPSVQLPAAQRMLVVDTLASSGSMPLREDVMADAGDDAGQNTRGAQSYGRGSAEGIRECYGARRSNSSNDPRSRDRCRGGGRAAQRTDTFEENAARGGAASVQPQSLGMAVLPQQQPSPPRQWQRQMQAAGSRSPSPSVQQQQQQQRQRRQSHSQDLSLTLQRRQQGPDSGLQSLSSFMPIQQQKKPPRHPQDRPTSGLAAGPGPGPGRGADYTDCVIQRSSTSVSAVLEAWYEEFPSASLSLVRQDSKPWSGRNSSASHIRTSNAVRHAGESGLGPHNTGPQLLRESSCSTQQSDDGDDGGFNRREPSSSPKMAGSSESNSAGDADVKIAGATGDGVVALQSSRAEPNRQRPGSLCASPLDSELSSQLLPFLGPPPAILMGSTGAPASFPRGPTVSCPRLPAPTCGTQAHWGRKRGLLRKQRSQEHARFGAMSDNRRGCSFSASANRDVVRRQSGNAGGVQSPRHRAPMVPKSGSSIPLAQPDAAPTPSPSLEGRNAPTTTTTTIPTGNPAFAIPTPNPSVLSIHAKMPPTGPGWLLSHASHLSQLVLEVGSGSGSGAGSILHRELLLLGTGSGVAPVVNVLTTHGTVNSYAMLPTGGMYSREALSTLPRTVSSGFDQGNHLAVAAMQNYWMQNGSTAGLTAAATAQTETNCHNAVGGYDGAGALRFGLQPPEMSPVALAALPTWQRPPCSRFRLPQLSESLAPVSSTAAAGCNIAAGEGGTAAGCGKDLMASTSRRVEFASEAPANTRGVVLGRASEDAVSEEQTLPPSPSAAGTTKTAITGQLSEVDPTGGAASAAAGDSMLSGATHPLLVGRANSDLTEGTKRPRRDLSFRDSQLLATRRGCASKGVPAAALSTAGCSMSTAAAPSCSPVAGVEGVAATPDNVAPSRTASGFVASSGTASRARGRGSCGHVGGGGIGRGNSWLGASKSSCQDFIAAVSGLEPSRASVSHAARGVSRSGPNHPHHHHQDPRARMRAMLRSVLIASGGGGGAGRSRSSLSSLNSSIGRWPPYLSSSTPPGDDSVSWLDTGGTQRLGGVDYALLGPGANTLHRASPEKSLTGIGGGSTGPMAPLGVTGTPLQQQQQQGAALITGHCPGVPAGPPGGVTFPPAVDGECSKMSSVSYGQVSTAQIVRWHEVHVKPVDDPISGEKVIMVIQTDVSNQVHAEEVLTRVLEAEQRLLADIFPRHVVRHMTAARNATAERQRNGLQLLRHIQDPAAVATSHECITVLFADIKGFTEMCKEVAPATVMIFLNDLYTRLDRRVRRVQGGDHRRLLHGRRGLDGSSRGRLRPGGADPRGCGPAACNPCGGLRQGHVRRGSPRSAA